MPRRLIVNADGFGFTAGNNRAIFDCLRAGFVRSVSVNVGFPAVEDLGRLVRNHPEVSAGLHVNLAVGRPVSPPGRVATLVDGRGEFWDAAFRARLLGGRIRLSHMVRELRAQFARMRDLAGRISHWDGHRNEHLLPGYFEAALTVARLFGVRRMRCHRHHLFLGRGSHRTTTLSHYLTHPAQGGRHAASRARTAQARAWGMRTPDRLITPAQVGPDSRKTEWVMWETLLRALPRGTSEIYAHPGYPDDTLRRYARYVAPRRREAAILSSPDLAPMARRAGVEPISFWEL